MNELELLTWAVFYGATQGGLLVLADRLRLGRLRRTVDSVHADAGGVCVQLSGETGGLRGALLRATGVSGLESVQVTGRGVRGRRAEYGGNSFLGVPLSAVTAVRSGQGRSLWLLIAAAVWLLAIAGFVWFQFNARLFAVRALDAPVGEVLSLAFAELVALSYLGAFVLVVLAGYFRGATADLVLEAGGRTAVRLRFRAGTSAERVANLAAVNRAAESIDRLLADAAGADGWSLSDADVRPIDDGESPAASGEDAFEDLHEISAADDPSPAKGDATEASQANGQAVDAQRANDTDPDPSGAVDLPPDGGDPFAAQADQYANQLYRVARRHAESGDRRTAVRILRSIVKEHPATPAAEKARRTLNRGQTQA